ncbi:protein FAR1-RELATED SEQUENCE 5-like [Vicia villosa]|uniref:protein FAR1-RELATED SEQUENCE 5-like n=1 Tax=Vicia villosa TaxID=3911 RepID=UPI00273B75F1|nr:protein FAR1-RELATED SEQUENCE 5-like [Vicia villosa]
MPNRNSWGKCSGMEVPLQICRKNDTAIDTTDAFTTSERFVTREEVIRWVKETGINNKVTVIITRSDTETGKRGKVTKSTPAKDGSGWKVDVKCGVHNHGLPDRLEGHSFVGRLTTDEKQHVADLTKRHVPPRHILISLQKRDPENVTRITQIYKHKSVIEAEIRGPRSEIQHLLKLIEEANYVYWSRKRDDCEVVRDMFWAHPDSVKLLNLFPTVLIMDATYKTNKYRQPLFEIVGMTSTELTFAVAFAYMECEQTESFIWVLE